ncbi:MAG: HEPN domain-containing protein [Candidatus Excrementavichristensenella sp.]
MPEITLVCLSRYRLSKAAGLPETAQRDMNAKDYASVNNRAYSCIFHAMRAVLALDGEDYKISTA